jgi:hypothetical protein
MTTTTTMNEVFTRLGAAGFKQRFVKKVALPSWWEPAVANTQAGLDETLLLLSRRLRVPYAALAAAGTDLRVVLPEVRFKADKDVDRAELGAPAALAAQVARLLLRAVPDAPRIDASARGARAAILSAHEWVGLPELVEHCWRSGIPVIHMSELPDGPKPAGMAVAVDGRFAIVLCRNDKFASKHLFNLGHELGHIALGHVQGAGVLVDAELGPDKGVSDPQETAANAFALELLCGSNVRVEAKRTWLTGDQLATSAVTFGRQHRIAPGHVVLNYGHTMTGKTGNQFFAVANKALGALGPLEPSDAVQSLRQSLDAHVQWDDLSPDDAEFVRRVVGLPDEST